MQILNFVFHSARRRFPYIFRRGCAILILKKTLHT